MDSYFYLFKDYCQLFFFFMSRCKQNKIKLFIIGCNLSKKHKLTQHKTQNGELNYVDHKFFFNFYQELPTWSKPWGQTSKYYIALPSWLVHVLCDFKATWHQEAYFSVSWCWIHHGSTSCLRQYFTFLVKVLPPAFHYKLGSYLYLFLLYILLSQNW